MYARSCVVYSSCRFESSKRQNNSVPASANGAAKFDIFTLQTPSQLRGRKSYAPGFGSMGSTCLCAPPTTMIARNSILTRPCRIFFVCMFFFFPRRLVVERWWCQATEAIDAGYAQVISHFGSRAASSTSRCQGQGCIMVIYNCLRRYLDTLPLWAFYVIHFARHIV